jgi:hypothetical protein
VAPQGGEDRHEPGSCLLVGQGNSFNSLFAADPGPNAHPINATTVTKKSKHSTLPATDFSSQRRNFSPVVRS